MAITHIITKEEFDTKVKNLADKITIVDFWAPWCGPCKMLGPIFEKISEEEKEINFVKVDIDKAEALAQEFGVRSIPTIIIIKNGKVIDTSMGALNPTQLKEFIAKNKN